MANKFPTSVQVDFVRGMSNLFPIDIDKMRLDSVNVQTSFLRHISNFLKQLLFQINFAYSPAYNIFQPHVRWLSFDLFHYLFFQTEGLI